MQDERRARRWQRLLRHDVHAACGPILEDEHDVQAEIFGVVTSPFGTTVTWMSADCAQSPPHPAAAQAVNATRKNRTIFGEDTPA